MKSQRGGIQFLVLAIVVLASVLLVGGNFLNFTNSVPPNQGQEFIPITPSPGDINQTNDTLQLKTIAFKGCSGTVTVDFLLDRTDSMNNLTPSRQTKISRLKEAVLALTSKLSDDSVIGIQSFNYINSNNFTDDVPISYYKDVKGIIPERVNGLIANGTTPTHDALAFSYQKLAEALPRFKDRKFNFILISDGQPIPETQDPRLFNPNPADQIKALGVNVFTLAVYDPSQAKTPALADLLKSIASKPENYYEAQSADQIASLLQQISTKLCDSPATPAPTAAPTPAPVIIPITPVVNPPAPTPNPQPVVTNGPTPVPAPQPNYCELLTPNELKTPNCVCMGGGTKIVCPSSANPALGGGVYVDQTGQTVIDKCYVGPNDAACLMSTSPGCHEVCFAKPVIYLYPTKPTNVSVKIETSGRITVSDPLYENGWENVLALPSGKLIYKSKMYSELFYETSVNDVKAPTDGLVVETGDIKKSLTDLTAKLGLTQTEQKELIEWWVPRIKALNKPYTLISLIDKSEKERTDRVIISPNPDTRIEFILYFKGLDYGISVPNLNLPPTPRRIGFTAVEWGGMIDY